MFAAALLTVFPSVALSCPAVPDNREEKDRLHSELLAARTEMHGRAVSNRIWEIWTTAPDDVSQAIMDKGRQRIRHADYEGAEQVFNALIEYCPGYAEGWNQRAYVRFLRQDYGNALEDIAVVLELEPRHFGALAGRAVTLTSMGRVAIGQTALREALKVNPWLSERRLLISDEEL